VSNWQEELLQPPRLWARDEVLAKPCPVPSEAGVYAWYFREPPSDDIDLSRCHGVDGVHLLYAGISPKRPSGSGKASAQNLRKRITYHHRGNAEGSTLRLTLGCLLSERLGIQLRRVGSGKRRTFADGEATLSDWMTANALVCWLATADAWDVESELIRSVDLPLNLDQNKHNPFHAKLTAARAECKKRADELPVAGS
jgi:hypothetical protein